MSAVAFWGAIETGLLYGFLSLGVYLSFRILKFPDLTVDGSFPLGAAVAATLIVQGTNPFLATGLAVIAGGLAGLCTAWLSVQLKILNLLASILTMIALYSINLRIMGKPNVALLGQSTLFDQVVLPLPHLPPQLETPILLLIALALVKVGVDAFLSSELGLAMRATGMNPTMAQAQGIATNQLILLGMSMSNALTALVGALFAQIYGFADAALGIGTVVAGLATVILGGVLLPGLTVQRATLSVILGSIVYRLAIALALNVDFLGFQAQDLNLVTAILVVITLVAPNSRSALQTFRKRRKAAYRS
ncbi:MAG: ABC transporter permease [Leptolyngbyaceae cyanobacterium MO_188.B28]|nr:ABC transporter permease [Leptolyngbyaceae cyanobacterium MO_188.B28]